MTSSRPVDQPAKTDNVPTIAGDGIADETIADETIAHVQRIETHRTRQFPIPTRLNLTIIVVQLICLFAVFYFTSLATAWWHLAILAGIFAILGNSIYSIIHEAEHGILHPNPAINEWLGVFMALFFPAPYHLIRQGHIGHHRRNRSDDEAFDLYFDGDRPVLKWLALYGIITGFYWMIVVLSNVVVVLFPFALNPKFWKFDRPSAAFMDSLNPAYGGKLWFEGLAAIGLHVTIVWLMGIPMLNYAIVYFGFGLSWSAMQYVHHYGTERHVVHGARNLWLFGPIDLVWLNHNWHAIHHGHPTIPWIYLPLIGQEEFEGQRGFLLWHYLRMWKGPRYTTERVENKFAGKIIQ